MATADVPMGDPAPLAKRRERIGFIVFTWLTTVGTLAAIAWGILGNRHYLQFSIFEIAVWMVALAILNVFELRGANGLRLSPDVPLVIAIAIVFPPAIAGLVAFIGAVDRRELGGAGVPTRLLFNRTQTALEVMAPSLVLHTLPPLPSDWRSLAVQATISLVLLTCTNYLLIAIAARIADGVPVFSTIRNLTLGKPTDFMATWIVWGLMGMLLVAAVEVMGPAAVIAFTLPTLLGRQLLAHSAAGMTQEVNLDSTRRAFGELSRRIADERRDERLRIASHLHDEVLQSLYQVALMCDVVRQDSASGRLLELDRDMPLLRTTVDIASKSLRDVIGRLRESPLGLRGLGDTLRSLIADLASQTSAHLDFFVGDLQTIYPEQQLLIYQVAKEALTNAVRHARATRVVTRLARDVDAVRLSIEDDGTGFDPRSAQLDHYGLLIMRERAETAGGILHIDSVLGKGTIVAARFPL